MSKRKATGIKDFEKVKRKVGKLQPLPHNLLAPVVESRPIKLLSTKVVGDGGPSKTDNLDDDDLVPVKTKETFQRILQQLIQHKYTVKKEALEQLKENLISHSDRFYSIDWAALVSALLKLIMDTEANIRDSFYEMLKKRLLPVDVKYWQPFLSLLLAYLKSSMTHLNPNIQVDSIKFLNIFLMTIPELFSTPMLLTEIIDLLVVFIDRVKGNLAQLNKLSKMKTTKDDYLLVEVLSSIFNAFMVSHRRSSNIQKDLLANNVFYWSSTQKPSIMVINSRYSINGTIYSHYTQKTDSSLKLFVSCLPSSSTTTEISGGQETTAVFKNIPEECLNEIKHKLKDLIEKSFGKRENESSIDVYQIREALIMLKERLID